MYKTGALVFTDEQEALLTGYRLHLAHKEAVLLHTMIERGAVKASGKNTLFSSLPVLVNSINCRSRDICGRKLVICQNGNYIINPHM